MINLIINSFIAIDLSLFGAPWWMIAFSFFMYELGESIIPTNMWGKSTDKFILGEILSGRLITWRWGTPMLLAIALENYHAFN